MHGERADQVGALRKVPVHGAATDLGGLGDVGQRGGGIAGQDGHGGIEDGLAGPSPHATIDIR